MDENDRETGPEAARARLPLVRRLRRPSEVYRRVLGEPTSSLRWSDVALVFCFFLAICLPLAGLLLRLDTGFVLDENRVLHTPAIKDSRTAQAALGSISSVAFNAISWSNVRSTFALWLTPEFPHS